jgi:hypothetical protein
MYPAWKGNEALELHNAWPEPWTIPDTLELEELARIAQCGPYIPHYSPETKYAYSAASAAVRFLHSISPKARAALRQVHIYEDRQSVSFPECYGRGFISFCQEDPELRVTRLVSLWKNVFPVSVHSETTYTDGDRSLLERLSNDQLPAEGITKSVGTWVMEALALPSLGMPEGSYALVLDGNPTPEHTSKVFRVVQRDVAWQAALDLAYSRGLLPEPSWQDPRRRKGYTYEGLPDVVWSLSRNSPLVRTNFDLGPVNEYDTESLLEERRVWSLQDWEKGWATHEPHEFQTAAPLPSWHLLRWGHVIL